MASSSSSRPNVLAGMEQAHPAPTATNTGLGAWVGEGIGSALTAVGLPGLNKAAVATVEQGAEAAIEEGKTLATGKNAAERNRHRKSSIAHDAMGDFRQRQNDERSAGVIADCAEMMDKDAANSKKVMEHHAEGQQAAAEVGLLVDQANIAEAKSEALAEVNQQKKAKEVDRAIKEKNAEAGMKKKIEMVKQQEKLEAAEQAHQQEDLDMDLKCQELLKKKEAERKTALMEEAIQNMDTQESDRKFVQHHKDLAHMRRRVQDEQSKQDMELKVKKRQRVMKEWLMLDEHAGKKAIAASQNANTKNDKEIIRLKKEFEVQEMLDQKEFDKKLEAKQKALKLDHNQRAFREATRLKEVQKGQYKDVLTALGVNEEDMRRERTRTCKASFSKLFFLAITLACEVDMYGFVLAAVEYSTIGKDVEGYPYPTQTNHMMKALLFTGPLAYLLAIGYYFWKQYQRSRSGGNDGGDVGDAFLPGREKEQQPLKKFNKLEYILPEEPFVLKHFHYIPIFRCYMLIKDLKPDDVEALFRVNSLSTFTLGFAQMMCLLFSASEGLLHVDSITMKVVLVNQAFNFAVTMFYFSTPIANQMKGATKVDAMRYNLRERMQREYVRFQDAVNQHSLSQIGTQNFKDTKDVVDKFHRMAEIEIRELATMPEADLEIFSMEEKFAIRRSLRIKEINGFIEMTKV